MFVGCQTDAELHERYDAACASLDARCGADNIICYSPSECALDAQAVRECETAAAEWVCREGRTPVACDPSAVAYRGYTPLGCPAPMDTANE